MFDEQPYLVFLRIWNGDYHQPVLPAPDWLGPTEEFFMWICIISQSTWKICSITFPASAQNYDFISHLSPKDRWSAACPCRIFFGSIKNRALYFVWQDTGRGLGDLSAAHSIETQNVTGYPSRFNAGALGLLQKGQALKVHRIVFIWTAKEK